MTAKRRAAKPTPILRNASSLPDRQSFTCACCGRLVVTGVDGLFTNPPAGSPRRFCSPACRQAAWRRRRAQVSETTPAQHHGGRARRLAQDQDLATSITDTEDQ